MGITRWLKPGLFCLFVGPALLALALLSTLVLSRREWLRRAGCLLLGLASLPLLLLARLGLLLGLGGQDVLNSLLGVLLPGKPALILEGQGMGPHAGLSLHARRLRLTFAEYPDIVLDAAGLSMRMELGSLFLGKRLFAHASVASAGAMGVVLHDLETELEGRGGRVVVDTAVRVFSGRVVERDIIEFNDGPPRWSLDARAHGIRLEEVLAAGFVSPWKEGGLGGRVSLRAQGKTPGALVASLRGSGEFILKDALVSGLVQAIPGLEALVLPGDLRLRAVSGSFFLEDGLIRNDDLTLDSAVLRGTGSGVVDLAGNAVNYALNLELAKGLMSAVVEVTGPLNARRYTIRTG